jgi:hypothetical protein
MRLISGLVLNYYLVSLLGEITWIDIVGAVIGEWRGTKLFPFLRISKDKFEGSSNIIP